jgi:putative membrane protein
MSVLKRSVPMFVCLIGIIMATSNTSARAEEPSVQDKAFFAEAGSGGMLEVRLGQYASANAASDAVKKFGEEMVGDHTKANDQLHTLTTQQPLEIPKAMSSEDQQTLDRLEKLHGAQFDKAYIEQMVQDHEKDVAAFEKEVSDGSDTIVRAFAERTLPILRHHLEMAKGLNESLSTRAPVAK